MTHPPFRLYLAPLQGFTDYQFRQAFFSTGGYADAAFAPFIDTHAYSQKDFKDILPQNNKGFHLIPQILGNDLREMIDVVRQIQDLGYEEINWNLGCPYPMVTRKKMGAGLLPFPNQIDQLLEGLMKNSTACLSVKMRLGFQNNEDWKMLTPILNRYPLSEVIVHARNAAQMYQGIPDLKCFAQVAAELCHPVCYNGDIFSLKDFLIVANEMPAINRFMLGRGLLSNPLLSKEIISGNHATKEEKENYIDSLHDQLIYQYSKGSKDPMQVINKVKSFWTYFSASFPGKENVLKKIKKSQQMEAYLEACRKIFTANI